VYNYYAPSPFSTSLYPSDFASFITTAGDGNVIEDEEYSQYLQQPAPSLNQIRIPPKRKRHRSRRKRNSQNQTSNIQELNTSSDNSKFQGLVQESANRIQSDAIHSRHDSSPSQLVASPSNSKMNVKNSSESNKPFVKEIIRREVSHSRPESFSQSQDKDLFSVESAHSSEILSEPRKLSYADILRFVPKAKSKPPQTQKQQQSQQSQQQQQQQQQQSQQQQHEHTTASSVDEHHVDRNDNIATSTHHDIIPKATQATKPLPIDSKKPLSIQQKQWRELRKKQKEPLLLAELISFEYKPKKSPSSTKDDSEQKLTKASKPKLTKKEKEQLPHSNFQSLNQPTVRHSKEREKPKPKKLTRLKKAILLEREQKYLATLRSQHNNESMNTANMTSEIRDQKDNSEKYHTSNINTANDTETPSPSSQTREGNKNQETITQPNDNIAQSLSLSTNNRQLEIERLKKIPKPPNKMLIREYCDQIITDALNEKVFEFLSKIYLLQERKRQRDPSKAAMHRRYVIGLREVARGVKLAEVKIVVIAPNIDENSSEDGLDSRVQDIIHIAKENNVLVTFALNRKKLGKAFGKTVRMSAVGVCNVDGANELYQEVVQLTLRYKKLAAIQRKVSERQRQKLKIDENSNSRSTPKHTSDNAPTSTKTKLIFPTIKYKNQEVFPDYFSQSLEELLKSENSALPTRQQKTVSLIESTENRNHTKNNQNEKWTVFIHNLQTNEILLFEEINNSIRVEDLKGMTISKLSAIPKSFPPRNLKFTFHGIELQDNVQLCDISHFENFSTIELYLPRSPNNSQSNSSTYISTAEDIKGIQ
jgi:selenocysteine insertion sequence-binding protein 2